MKRAPSFVLRAAKTAAIHATKTPVNLSRLRHGALALAAAAVLLAGCISDDEIRALRFSPDGTRVAVVTDRRGLWFVDPAEGTPAMVEALPVIGDDLAWDAAGRQVAYASNPDGHWDIFVTGLDGVTTRITRALGRQSRPRFLPDGRLAFLSTTSGRSEVILYDSCSRVNRRLVGRDSDVTAFEVSPDGTRLAFISFDNLRPQVYLFDLVSGVESCLTSETSPLGLESGALAWSPAGDSLAFVRREFAGGAPRDRLCAVTAAAPASERVLARENTAIGQPFFAQDRAHVYYIRGGRELVRAGRDGLQPLRLDGFPVSLAAPSAADGRIVLAAGQRLLAVTDPALRRAEFLPTDVEDRLVLAEEYLRRGRRGESRAIYEELRAGLGPGTDPSLARLFELATLVRLGRTREAVEALEQMAVAGAVPPQVPARYVWRMLGYAHLLWLNNPEKARDCLREYDALARAQEDEKTTREDTARNALAILESGDARLIRHYTRGLRARLAADMLGTAREFGALLEASPQSPAVRAEYLRALAGYDREVYLFALSERPFEPSPAQRIAYLERFVHLAPDAPQADAVRVELFQLHIETRSPERARALLLEALDKPSDPNPLEDLQDVLGAYLETAEAAPWLEPAMTNVFLHPSVRPRIEAWIGDDPRPDFRLRLAAAKVHLAGGQREAARAELDGAMAAWERLGATERTAEDHLHYARLLVMRGREAELGALYAEAAAFCEQAADHIRRSRADEFEFMFDAQFHAAMLRALLADGTDPKTVLSADYGGGSDLVNPSWDPVRLTRGVEAAAAQQEAARRNGQPAQYLHALRLGLALRALRQDVRARPALMAAIVADAPEFVRLRALVELGNLDDSGDDPWNSARWFLEAGSLPASDAYAELYLSFRVAEQRLSINHMASEARTALLAIASNAPDTPLAIRAQELLAANR
ncbi:MAG: hypothetical protein N2111_13615 [Candidatus Sumerlaeaceae bacterium]|nr:hypothetical protein [Candidatus Sumerlaeaceae bacterium]